MADGLSSHLGDIGSESILDSSISSADIAPGAVGNSDLADDAVSGAKIANQGVAAGKLVNASVSATQLAAAAVTASKHAILGTGSPTVYGNSVLAGEYVTSAGSVAAIAFPTSFAAAPILVLGNGVGGTSVHSLATINATGCTINSEAASESGTYLAIGSGAI